MFFNVKLVFSSEPRNVSQSSEKIQSKISKNIEVKDLRNLDWGDKSMETFLEISKFAKQLLFKEETLGIKQAVKFMEIKFQIFVIIAVVVRLLIFT